MTKAVLAALVLCAVCVNSDDFYGRSDRAPEYVRIKRAKYYSNPPMRFYRRPPSAYPVKGIFSYTPPPNYMDHDDPHPGNFKPKVSKRPTNTGLEEEDISNIVKHLSKQDLDKIIEFAGEKYRQPPSFNRLPVDDEKDINVYKSSIRELNTDQKYLLDGPYVANTGHANYEMEYKDISRPPINNNAFKPFNEPDGFSVGGPLANFYGGANDQFNYVRDSPPPSNTYHSSPPGPRNPQDLTDVPLHTEESMQTNQFSFVDAHIQQELDNDASKKTITAFTDSETMKEEQLPKPLNLREEQDYQLASTNNVPAVVKSSSYQVESFGDLPLMDYNSKRYSVSSYHVPHYSVISQQSNHPPPPASPSYYSQPSSSSQLVSSPSAAAIKAPKLEPAPPASAAKEQSDAHLKATKIWTHRSRGTAYTLHDDGTLSLEKPQRLKPIYGP